MQVGAAYTYTCTALTRCIADLACCAALRVPWLDTMLVAPVRCARHLSGCPSNTYSTGSREGCGCAGCGANCSFITLPSHLRLRPLLTGWLADDSSTHEVQIGSKVGWRATTKWLLRRLHVCMCVRVHMRLSTCLCA